jgi:hypothetical protein
LKAILTYSTTIDGKTVEQTRIFDTEKASKICDVANANGYKAQEIYITKKGVLFIYSIKSKKIEVADQKQCKEWIGEHAPDEYIKFFGEVEEG